MEKCNICVNEDCPLRYWKHIPRPEDLHEKYLEISKLFSDLDVMYQYGLDTELSSEDMDAISAVVVETMKKDPGTKLFSKKMRARLSTKRFHYPYKKSHMFFNFIKGKGRHILLSNFLKTVTMPSEKGQLHFISGSNFTICAVSHFFDRFIKRNEFDINRPQSMDLLYRRLLHNPIQITPGPVDDFFRLNEGIAIGKSFGTTHRIFIFMTYITEEQLSDKQRQFMQKYEMFQPRLRNIRT